MTKGSAVPADRHAGRMEAPAGQTDIERGKVLVAGVLQVILGGDVNERGRLCSEGNSNFLMFDDVTRPEWSGTGNKPERRAKHKGDG